MMTYPTHDVYASLYSRYLEGHRTQELVALAGPLAGKRVVDLCGGGGRLSRLAVALGATVKLVDESADMTAGVQDAGLQVLQRSVFQWLHCFMEDGAQDVMFCQQAVNYWFTPDLAELVALALSPGGQFIFNTFNKQPPSLPVPKAYSREGVGFVELSWLSPATTGHPAMVEHVQIREGHPPHTTRFMWIAPETFRAALAPHFHTKEYVDGPTSIWCCTKKAG